MRARDIVGKTVSRVMQSTDSCWNVGRATTVDQIQFTDGSVLVFDVLEHKDQGGYGVRPVLYPHLLKGGR